MVGLNDRRREWLENITQLKKKKEKELNDFEEKKKKELAEIEEKKRKELEEAEEMLKAGVEDLTEEEEQALEHLRKEIPELEELEQEKSLEETIAQEKIPEEAKSAGPIYETPIEEMVTQVYQQTNYNAYNELKGALDKVKKGEYLNREERDTIYKRQEEIESLNKTLEADPIFLRDKDPYGYVERSKQVIDSIEKSLHSSTQYKTGDHT